MTVFLNKQRVGRHHWRYDFWLKGQRYIGPCVDSVTSKPAANKREALAIEALERAKVQVSERTRRSISRPGSFSLGQAMLLHLDSQVGSSVMPVANLKLYGREILAYFGPDTPVVEISQAWVDEYRRDAAVEKVKVWRGGPRRREKAPAKEGHGERPRSPASVNH